jgi:hypothetical protein
MAPARHELAFVSGWTSPFFALNQNLIVIKYCDSYRGQLETSVRPTTTTFQNRLAGGCSGLFCKTHYRIYMGVAIVSSEKPENIILKLLEARENTGDFRFQIWMEILMFFESLPSVASRDSNPYSVTFSADRGTRTRRAISPNVSRSCFGEFGVVVLWCSGVVVNSI